MYYDIKAIERLHFDIYNQEARSVTQKEADELTDLLERSDRVADVVEEMSVKYRDLF